MTLTLKCSTIETGDINHMIQQTSVSNFFSKKSPPEEYLVLNIGTTCEKLHLMSLQKNQNDEEKLQILFRIENLNITQPFKLNGKCFSAFFVQCSIRIQNVFYLL
ncbi:CLUMA_CG018554, isoform A [Clunio marinus]|uniref:CLUMA_CG018554, isoform A n=1 Tax=Clunio marinus TaxID=568069 RepID=A0A1J1J1J5_9DIPT|nr:CLUMA_CG018554, isoform A [Clunio marinus]